jgi:hypothetical protein
MGHERNKPKREKRRPKKEKLIAPAKTGRDAEVLQHVSQHSRPVEERPS